MRKRPYLYLNVSELKNKFLESKRDKTACDDLLYELKFRKAKKGAIEELRKMLYQALKEMCFGAAINEKETEQKSCIRTENKNSKAAYSAASSVIHLPLGLACIQSDNLQSSVNDSFSRAQFGFYEKVEASKKSEERKKQTRETIDEINNQELSSETLFSAVKLPSGFVQAQSTILQSKVSITVGEFLDLPDSGLNTSKKEWEAIKRFCEKHLVIKPNEIDSYKLLAKRSNIEPAVGIDSSGSDIKNKKQQKKCSTVNQELQKKNSSSKVKLPASFSSRESVTKIYNFDVHGEVEVLELTSTQDLGASKKSEETKKQAIKTIDEFHSQELSTETLFSAVKLPSGFVQAQSNILQTNASITVGDFLDLPDSGLNTSKKEWEAIKRFCEKRLVSNSNDINFSELLEKSAHIEPAVVIDSCSRDNENKKQQKSFSQKEIIHQLFSYNTAFSSIKLASRLINAQSDILESNASITVGEFLKLPISGLTISLDDFVAIKKFCKERLVEESKEIAHLTSSKKSSTPKLVKEISGASAKSEVDELKMRSFQKVDTSKECEESKKQVRYSVGELNNQVLSSETSFQSVKFPPRLAIAQSSIVQTDKSMTVGKFLGLPNLGLIINKVDWQAIKKFCEKRLVSKTNEVDLVVGHSSTKAVDNSSADLKNKQPKSYSTKELNNQIITLETAISAIKLPNSLASAQINILKFDVSITLDKFMKTSHPDLKISRADFVSIKKFCKARLAEESKEIPHLEPSKKSSELDSEKKIYSSSVENETDVLGTRSFQESDTLKNEEKSTQISYSVSELNNQVFSDETQFHSVKLPPHLVSAQSDILQSDASITVGKFMEKQHADLMISRGDFFDIKYFCRRRLAQDSLGKESRTFSSTPKNICRVKKALSSSTIEPAPTKRIDKKSIVIDQIYSVDKPKKNILVGQNAFYQLSNEHFTIVDAPPGCGKTHCIVHKLHSHLAQMEQFYDAKKILVLSFTRNAVNELKKRIVEHIKVSKQKNLDLIRVMTFDAFASRVLRDSDDGILSNDFEKNITKVKALLIDGYKGGCSLIDDVKWIYIDEYQDLVGTRADLVTELTKLVSNREGSVSLLGDSCQQIMNFQLRKSSSKTTNEEFIYNFEKLASKKLVRIELSESYRFNTLEQKALVDKLRSQLLASSISIDSREFAEQISLAKIQNDFALLCRTNIDCYLAKWQLSKLGRKTYINNGSSRISVPAWVFDVFKGWQQNSMSRSTFIERCQHNLSSFGKDEWNYLLSLGCCNNEKIQVDRLVRIIEDKGGIAPQIDSQTIVISTVHKAKGLQYPKVVFLPSTLQFKKKTDALRQFYVAVTRAQDAFFFLDKSQWPTLKKSGKSGVYKSEDNYLLEGIGEIALDSFFPNAESLNSSDIDFVMSSKAKFQFEYIEKKVFVVSTLPCGKKIKIYRLPRLEKCLDIAQPNYVSQEIIPESFATFVYAGESSRLDNILGPTCLIKVPVFEGFWNAKKL